MAGEKNGVYRGNIWVPSYCTKKLFGRTKNRREERRV
jgi:hypothetical protein